MNVSRRDVVISALLLLSSPLIASTSVDLSWQPSARASSYDLYLGTSNPPRLYASGITGTSRTVSGLATGTAYYWFVIAHADCDPALTIDSAVKSFTTAGSCSGVAAVTLTSPGDNDGSVPPTATLSWSEADGAGSYDLYLGAGPSPPLYLSDLQQTAVLIPRLSPGTEYAWRVVAKAACDPSRNTSSATRKFVVRTTCAAPSVPVIASSQPAAVSPGATYAISWRDAADLDAGGSYLIERSSDPSFSSILDSQQTTATSASFTVSAEGTYYHRVRSIAGCSSAARSAPSPTISVPVRSGAAVVTFTMEPQAIITSLGERLEDQATFFALENLSSTPVQVLVAPQLLGSVPFFTIVDPFGGDGAFVTLEPHKPKTLRVQFSGPSNNEPGTYQGIIYVTSAGQPLAFTPQAYINLKVGADAAAAAPKLLVNGLETDFVYFPPATGDDSSRPAITVDLLNSGTVLMEVAGEIGPEAWLKLEKDWNASPVSANAFRTIRLYTQRTRAVAGSGLPRYTYFTVRNKAGQSTRLLIEDSGAAPVTMGRSAPLGAGELSIFVPLVRTGSAGTTTLHLTNTSSLQAPAELLYTPEGIDGFDGNNVKRATVMIPPSDGVAVTDPLAQVFGVGGDAAGTLEIRSSNNKLGALVVRSEHRSFQSGGGAYGYTIPVLMRGEGARVGSAHRLAGIASTADLRTSLSIVETSGREKTSVHLSLFDKTGAKRGEQTIEVPRYGLKRFDDVAQTFLSGGSLDTGRLDVEVTSGGGSIIAMATVLDRSAGSGASVISQAVSDTPRLSALGRVWAAAATTAERTLIIPGVVSDTSLKTTLGFAAAGAGSLKLSFRDETSGRSYQQNVTVSPGQIVEYGDVAKDAFGLTSSAHGTVTIVTDAAGVPYARVRGSKSADSLTIISPYSESVSGSGSFKPLYADGLDQSLIANRGHKTSLVLTEVSRTSPATVRVRLYEPGNRSLPITEKDFTVESGAELRLDNVFASMGLETDPDALDQRRKNRVNVAAVVIPRSGSGAITAEAVQTDLQTGDRRSIVFRPVGVLPASEPQRQDAATTPGSGRRRAVGH